MQGSRLARGISVSGSCGGMIVQKKGTHTRMLTACVHSHYLHLDVMARGGGTHIVKILAACFTGMLCSPFLPMCVPACSLVGEFVLTHRLVWRRGLALRCPCLTRVCRGAAPDNGALRCAPCLLLPLYCVISTNVFSASWPDCNAMYPAHLAVSLPPSVTSRSLRVARSTASTRATAPCEWL